MFHRIEDTTSQPSNHLSNHHMNHLSDENPSLPHFHRLLLLQPGEISDTTGTGTTVDGTVMAFCTRRHGGALDQICGEVSLFGWINMDKSSEVMTSDDFPCFNQSNRHFGRLRLANFSVFPVEFLGYRQFYHGLLRQVWW